MIALIHYGAGVTDCGREVDELVDGELTTSARGLVTCAECVDAYDHLRSKRVDVDANVCRMCGCSDDDCRDCIVRTGQPCHWVDSDLCSACVES